jgi:starch-binding outer membrane protein, SusD/RagB family
MKNIKLFFVLLFTVVLVSCTKLDERFRSELEENNTATITPGELLLSAYNSLNGPFQWGDVWHIEQHPTDETIAPTRGPDWDDNGQWRALHAHTWNADQGQIRGAFNGLLGIQFAASNVLEFNPSAQQAAEARFIRALSMYYVLDGYDQVPYREDLSDYKKPPITLVGMDAANFIISELEAIMATLPATGPAYVANQDAAKVLLMKIYLNKGVYANRAAPTFDAGDMTKVITLADEIIATNKYNLTDNASFFDHFAPTNDVLSKENIFTLYNNEGERGGNVRGNVFAVSHYNMNPGGWNGFSTLSEFYDKFEPADERLGGNYVYPGSLPNPGNRQNVGFLLGQQYNLTSGEALQDRKGNPLFFTREVALRETGDNLEVTGIRVIKYPYDYASSGDQKDNDWVIFRYSDVLLMKAEALMRTGGDGLPLVNQIRAARGATNLAGLTEADVLDERGRELYWEGWRRQDLIRFGKYLEPWHEKAASDPRVLLFPIPSDQLAVNPNLTQNPGY